jgi:hypothetical protein
MFDTNVGTEIKKENQPVSVFFIGGAIMLIFLNK